MMRRKHHETLVLGGESSFSIRNPVPGSSRIASRAFDPTRPVTKEDELVCPNFFQALCDEPVPTGGIPVKLGHIGAVADQYTISEFKQIRAHARSTSSAALHDSAQIVIKIIQQVGSSVQQRVNDAKRQAAKSTRKEFREKRFELNSQSACGSALKDEEAAKARNLYEAKADKERFVMFLTLVEALTLKHVRR